MNDLAIIFYLTPGDGKCLFAKGGWVQMQNAANESAHFAFIAAVIANKVLIYFFFSSFVLNLILSYTAIRAPM